MSIFMADTDADEKYFTIKNLAADAGILLHPRGGRTADRDYHYF